MNLQIISCLMGALGCIILGIFVYLKNKKGFLNISFILFNISLAIWNLGDIFIIFSSSIQQALFWDKISYVSAVFFISFLICVVFALIEFSTDQIKKRFFIIGTYTLCLSILIFTPLIIKDISIKPFVETPGQFYFLFIIFFIGGFIYALYLLTTTYAKADNIKRLQIKYVGLALLVDLLAGIYYFLTLYNTSLPPFHYFIELTASAIFAYAIVRYHLMDIDIIIKRTALYSILTTIIAGSYISIIFLFEHVLQITWGYSSLVIRIIAGFIIAVSFQTLYSKIEYFIDHIFYRTKYNYEKTLLDFSQSLTSILKLRELLEYIIEVVVSALKIKEMSIILWNKELKLFTITSAIGLSEDYRTWQYNIDSELISWLGKNRKIAVRSHFINKSSSENNAGIINEMHQLKSELAVPLFHKDELIGVFNIGKKLSGQLYSNDDLNLLDILSSEAAIAIANANLYNELEKYYLQTVNALAQAIEASDEYTRGHCDRITETAVHIAKLLRLPRKDIEVLQYACILHDIGKIGIKKEILNKTSKLTKEEYEHIKTHTLKGEEIIAPVAFLKKVRPVIRHHHEQHDGSGYPDGLKGNEIPLLAKIISIADAFDAIISTRPYRTAQSVGFAISEISRGSGHQFCPEIVEVFLKICKMRDNGIRS